MLRFVVPLMLAAAGCAPAPHIAPGNSGLQSVQIGAQSNWRLSNTVDRITGKANATLSVDGQAKYTKNPRGGFAIIALFCVEKQPRVMVTFDFPVGSKGTSTLSYRFDDKEGQSVDPEFFNTSAPVIRKREDVATFISQAKISNQLYLRVSSPIGLAEAEFVTSGGNESISSFEQGCNSKGLSTP